MERILSEIGIEGWVKLEPSRKEQITKKMYGVKKA